MYKIKHHVRETWTVENETGNKFELDSEPVDSSVTIEKIDNGYKVKYLARELYPQHPRTEFDNMGTMICFRTMICFHSRHDLGDEHKYKKSDFNGQEELIELITRDYGKIAVVLPLYLYDHSGITMATHPFNDYWDSRQIGIIFVTEEKVIEEYGDLLPESIEKARNYLEGEVQTYDQYLTGDVYICCTVTFDEDENEIDRASCGGFYGYEYAKEALKSGNY